MDYKNTTGSDDSVALCVDLDGTLLRTDVLYESVLALLGKNPLYLFLLPFWLLRGKAALKREIASRVDLDPALLPYDERLLQMLASTQARPRVLCTATDAKFAEAIGNHLGFFELVLASDGENNLAGSRKAQSLVDRFGERGFDYVGNDRVDLDVWRRSRQAWVVNGSESLKLQASRVCEAQEHFPAQGSRLRAWIKATRIHQWLKNLLVFLPLLASHRFLDASAVTGSVAAFTAFGLCASGVYVLNDLLDLPADRQHPRKRLRPFASGQLQLSQGLIAAPLLTLAGFGLAIAVGAEFALVLAGYYVMTLLYSFRLKRIVMVDVVLLAALYTVRIVGGTMAINATLSFWLLAFSMFIFLSLAMLKRYTELDDAAANGKQIANGRGYAVEDLPLLQSLGAASGYLAVLVLALYINSPESLQLYRRPQLLWLVCPMLLYWISRAWVVAHRGGMHDDPVVFAVTDRVSQVVMLTCGLMVLVAI